VRANANGFAQKEGSGAQRLVGDCDCTTGASQPSYTLIALAMLHRRCILHDVNLAHRVHPALLTRRSCSVRDGLGCCCVGLAPRHRVLSRSMLGGCSTRRRSESDEGTAAMRRRRLAVLLPASAHRQIDCAVCDAGHRRTQLTHSSPSCCIVHNRHSFLLRFPPRIRASQRASLRTAAAARRT
jgi:hypothetical protein